MLGATCGYVGLWGGNQLPQLSVSFTGPAFFPHSKSCCYMMRKLKQIPAHWLSLPWESEKEGEPREEIEWHRIKTKPNQTSNKHKSQPSNTFWSFSSKSSPSSCSFLEHTWAGLLRQAVPKKTKREHLMNKHFVWLTFTTLRTAARQRKLYFTQRGQ